MGMTVPTDQNYWAKLFAAAGSYWLHDGNPKRPHALLTSGNHSNGFFNASKVIRDPNLLAEAIEALALKLVLETRVTVIDEVHGSALGAIPIALELARRWEMGFGFTEPVVEDGRKRMRLKRFEIAPGTNVLVVEDVITTGGTTLETIAGIESAGGVVSPTVGVLVNRSGLTHLDGRRIVALVDQPMPMWTPEECTASELCSKGSEALRPKQSWAELTANY